MVKIQLHEQIHWRHGSTGENPADLANRVVKIQLHEQIHWRHVSTGENPADLASTSGQIKQETLWNKGPKWLKNKERWPNNLVTKCSPASEAEAKAPKEILYEISIKENADEFDQLLERMHLRRTLRDGARIRRSLYITVESSRNRARLRPKMS